MASSGRGGTRPSPAARSRRQSQTKGDRREDAILDAVGALLASRSIDAVTVDDIARSAGLSRSSFYFYFESRDAAVLALAARVGGELQDLFSANTAELTGPESIRRLCHQYLTRWRRVGHILRAMDARYGTDPLLHEHWDQLTATIRGRIAALIEHERASGLAVPGPSSAADLTRILVAMAWRVGFEASLRPPSEVADAKVADAMATVWIRAVYGHD